MGILKSLLILGSWILICISVAIYCHKYFPKQKELSRKIVHIGTGPIIPMALWLDISSEIAAIASFIVTFCLIINYKFRFISAVEDIQRQSYGTIAYASSITILIILFWNSNPSAVCAGVLVMAFGDGLAGLLGRQIKSSNWQILGQTKSIAGTLTMLGMGTLMLFLITLNNFVNINLVQIISISLLATGLEQISVMGIDNLSVPLVTAFAWNWITKI